MFWIGFGTGLLAAPILAGIALFIWARIEEK